MKRPPLTVKHLSADDLRERLSTFEKRYGMSSADFYAKYNRGELGEKADYMRWAIYYDMAARAGLIDSHAAA